MLDRRTNWCRLLCGCARPWDLGRVGWWRRGAHATYKKPGAWSQERCRQVSKSLTPENDVRRNAPDASQLPTSAATATATRLGMRGHSHHHQITISSSTSTSSTTLLPVLLHPRDQERPRTSQPGVGHIELCLRAVEKGRLRSRSSQQRSPEDRRNASEWDTPQSQDGRSRNSGLACGSQSLT